MLANSLGSDKEEDIELDAEEDEIVSNVLSLSEDTSSDASDENSWLAKEAHSHNTAAFNIKSNNNAWVHALSPLPPEVQSPEDTVSDATEAMGRRYDSTAFRGLLIDYGCSYLSTGGIAQYVAYCRENGLEPEANTSKRAASFSPTNATKPQEPRESDFPSTNVGWNVSFIFYLYISRVYCHYRTWIG